MTNTTKNIARAAAVVLIMNLVSKILGYGREAVIAHSFGAKHVYDAFLVAYTLPYFLQAILGVALVTTVVPILTKYLVEKNYDEAWHVASAILNLTLVGLLVLTCGGIVGSTVLVKLTAPGFTPDVAQLAAFLTRIMFPSLIFMGVGMVITGILNASYKFGVAAFAQGFYNLITIFSVIFFSSKYGITGLAVGTVVGFAGFMFIQAPVLRSIKFKYTFTFDFRHPAVKQATAFIGPIVLGVAVNQIYYALNRVFASGLMEGSISALNYANLVMTLPLGVFVSAIVSAIYPALSTHAITGDKRSLADTMLKGLGMVSLIAIPAAVGLMVLRVPIVSLLFERGMFDHQATMATAQALLYFSVGLFPAAANMIITRAYYAVSDVRTPVVVGLISIVADLLLSIVLVGKMGHAGLALANSLAAGVNTLFLFYGLKKHIPDLKARKLLISLGKICAASILMAVITYFIASYLGQKINLEGDRGLIILVGTAISAGALSYFIAATAFKVEDIRSVQEIMIRKIRKIPRRVDN